MTTPSVYVGTYAKYNSGSIAGAWLDLTKYSDHDEFMQACKALHNDEADPELMFQDFEGFPKQFYSECQIDAALFDYLALDDNDRELLEAYIEATGLDDATIEDARDNLYGRFDNDTDLAYEYVESTGLLHGVDDSIKNYFDYEAFGRDLAYDFTEHNGFYFFNH